MFFIFFTCGLFIVIDIIFKIFEPLGTAWNFSYYINYFGRSFIIDLTYVVIASIIFSLIVFITGKLVKKSLFTQSIPAKGIAFGLSSLLILKILYPINSYLLPMIYELKSILINIVIILLTIPIFYGIYKLLNAYKKISENTTKYFAIISIIPLSIIIISFIITPHFNQSNVKFEDIEPEKEYNIIIITIDALRADHLSCYGYKTIETKNIDGFSETAILFTNAYPTSSWTTPSMMSMLTSKYPTVHGCNDLSKMRTLSNNIPSIVEVVNKCDYNTYGVVANHLLDYRFGFSRGFDYYYEYGDFKPIIPFKETRLGLFVKKLLTDVFIYFGFSCDSTLWTTDTSVSILRNIEEPFFLWTHYLDPHCPYSPPFKYIPGGAESREKTIEFAKSLGKDYYTLDNFKDSYKNSLLNLYDGEILYVDGKLNKLFGVIKERDLLDNTMIIISSDHGEEFLEHGGFDHGKTFYQEVVNIPFILHLPEDHPHRNINDNINTPISLADIPVTIIDLLNIKSDELAHFSGRSIIKTLNNKNDNRIIYGDTLQHNQNIQCIWDNKWTFIYDEKNDVFKLYNRESDPSELNNLAKENEKVLQKFHKELSIWKSDRENELKFYGEAEEINLDKESLERIRGLGYIE